MQLFWGIIGIIVIVYVRIWIINNAFKNKNFKRHLSFDVFILSIFLVTFLYFYKDLLIFFNVEHLYFLENNGWKNVASFVFYCFAFIILLTGSFGNFKKKSSFKFISTALILFCGLGLGGTIMGINVLFMYHIISSYAEEILKFSVGQNIFLEKQEVNKHTNMSKGNKKFVLVKTDLMFFAIMAGLGFSVIENMFYLIMSYFSGGRSILMGMGRSVFATLLHIVSTGLIAFFVIKKYDNKGKNLLKYFVGILAGFGLHGIYNLSLSYNIKIVTIAILIVCYFVLTYLLFNSDLIYQKK
ncbi:MAG TPA: PrsW family glutamic-type intramembrane protease [Candidatus Absconditabacterales bacterium]|nr:PrsW family glutamic-type intramembrane protease [Candidatus Absconditabacterales bacterium]HOQ78696.1 PrsW family glutamic-type intramembrane protease [Candidatus Absconditabacterales bacterium]HPK27734.1 PrsW family glutamic-type intramembrane protease [Candidatus Absconditabacterales bacterium]